MCAGDLRLRLADYAQAIALANEGLTLAREQGDEPTIAHALSLLGIIAIDRGELVQARVYHEECLALNRRLDQPSAVARVLHSLANQAYFLGDYPRAIQLAKETHALANELGEESNAAAALLMLARIFNAKGEADRALDYARECIAVFRHAGNILWLPAALFTQGDILRALHRDAETTVLYDEGIAIARDVGAARDEFWGVMGRAEALYALGDYPEAGRVIHARVRGSAATLLEAALRIGIGRDRAPRPRLGAA